MKKYLFNNILFLLVVLSFSNVYGTNNSTTNERTKAFIQVWGLVKYKSINGAQGKFKADSVFLTLINNVKKADENQFRELIALLLKEIQANLMYIGYTQLTKAY